MFEALLEKNSAETLLIAAGIAVAAFGTLYVVRATVVRKLFLWSRQSAAQWDDLLVDVIASTHNLSLLAVALLIALSTLSVAPRIDTLVQHGFTLVLLLQVGLWANRALRGWRDSQLRKQQVVENGAGRR